MKKSICAAIVSTLALVSAATATVASAAPDSGSAIVRVLPSAHTAQACARYTVAVHRNFAGEHWRYRIRIQRVHAQNISCTASRGLIKRADQRFSQSRNVAEYYSVPPWQCEALRPYGGPHFQWNEDCKRSRGGRLSWQEEQLSAERTS